MGNEIQQEEKYNDERYTQMLLDGEIKSIDYKEGYYVSFNQGGCEGMANNHYKTLGAAKEAAAYQTGLMSQERYAEKEDFPVVTKDFMVTFWDGKILHTHDIIYYYYYWQ